MSPAGAWSGDRQMTGRANFGFVAKYQKGANVPTGNTEFQFKAGNLNFNSTAYEWLAVAGMKAQYKGAGTINGQAGYTFLLTALDGDTRGSDAFRIKIRRTANPTDVVYDNKSGSAGDSNDATIIDGGSIVVHQAK
jgi:hypothetical protein